MIETLRTLASRRRSDLADPAVWLSLGLPETSGPLFLVEQVPPKFLSLR